MSALGRGGLSNLAVQARFPLSAPTAPPVHFPTTLHRSIAKTTSDQCVKPCWKNRPTLKLWREFGVSERKRRNIPLEHPQGHQKKLCFQGDLGGRLGRKPGSARWRLEQEREPKRRNSLWPAVAGMTGCTCTSCAGLPIRRTVWRQPLTCRNPTPAPPRIARETHAP